LSATKAQVSGMADLSESGRALPHSKTGADVRNAVLALASWSGAVLRRFQLDDFLLHRRYVPDFSPPPDYRERMEDLLFRDDPALMREALRLAGKAAASDEVPIGAVIARNGRIIGRGYNQVELLKDPTAHAEILAITQAAAAVGDWRLSDCDLVVTKEPCPMCAGAAVHARLRRVVFGCEDPRGGAAGGLLNVLQMPQLNHRCDIASGVLSQECSALLQEFFRNKRDTIKK
jgi:tRNA(adenine34) deaminase